MARSSDPRKPLPAERGPKRTGPIGSIVPGDDLEVAREIQRIWAALSALDVGRIKRVESADGSIAVGNPAGPVVDLAALGGGGGALTHLATQTLAADGALDVSGISQAYRDLVVCVYCRSQTDATTPILTAQVNGVGDPLYHFQFSHTEQNATTDYYSAVLSQYAEVCLTSQGSSVWTSAVVEILGYADASAAKLMLTRAAGHNGASGKPFSSVGSCFYSAAQAIDRIAFANLNGIGGRVLDAGSRVDVYGRGAA